MEDSCLSKDIASFNLLNPQRVYFVLQSESRHLELTKSILNIIYNIVKVESLEATSGQKKTFEEKEDLVWNLLSPALSLSTKKRLLEENIDLVLAAAESCQP